MSVSAFIRVAWNYWRSHSLVNPVVALCLGVTLGGETVTAWEWLASGVVVMGVVLLLKAPPK